MGLRYRGFSLSVKTGNAAKFVGVKVFAVEVPITMAAVMGSEDGFRMGPRVVTEEEAILSMFSNLDTRIKAVIEAFKPNARPNSFLGIRQGLDPFGHQPMLVFDEINEAALAQLWVNEWMRNLPTTVRV